MIVTDSGIIIRISVGDIGIYSRNTQGVKLINVSGDESVAKVAIVEKEEDVEEASDQEAVSENSNETAAEGIDNPAEE